MKCSSSHRLAALAACALSFGVPSAVLADDTPVNDIALDLSLPADYPVVANQPEERRPPLEPLGEPAPSRFDLPMLGSALDLTDEPQVGEVRGTEE